MNKEIKMVACRPENGIKFSKTTFSFYSCQVDWFIWCFDWLFVWFKNLHDRKPLCFGCRNTLAGKRDVGFAVTKAIGPILGGYF